MKPLILSLFLASILSAAGAPNILFILVDDLGFGDLSSHGAEDMETPHIDALMAAGLRFDHAYANCPVCSPTRASLMTGKYPDLAGVPGVIRTHPEDSWGFLDPKAVTLPDKMKTAGYDTALIGKWHLGLESPNKPTERGFDHFHGFLCDMIDDYWTHRRFGINYMRLNDQEIDPKGHATDLFSQWAAEYIQKKSKSEKPWFMYLAYNAPHSPIHPPKDWLEKVTKREPDISETRAKLVALIEHLDDGIGKVIASLKESGQAENTLIVFTSDNGGQENCGANNGANRGAKQDMWEGGIRVPTCAVWPGKIKPGSRSQAVTMTMDWYPTLCEIAGAPAENLIDGKSLRSVLSGDDTAFMNAPRDLIWVRREGGAKYGGRDYYAIRRGSMKYEQQTPFEPMVLHDLSTDNMEATPLKQPKTENELRAALMKHLQRAGRIPWQTPSSN
jgi:arylsulfatase A-like enzyme